MIGRYELQRKIVFGEFPAWEARDRELGRLLTLVPMPAGFAKVRPDEAEAIARISHPNIITIFDVGRWEDGSYLAFEYLTGSTLAHRLQRGAIAIPEALRVAIAIARGLAYAHARGVTHRNLTPANVSIGERGEVKLVGLGFADIVDRPDDARVFLAPEQLGGFPGDERTDVFALGLILFQMLSGELPFPERRAATERLSPKRLSFTVTSSGPPRMGRLRSLLARLRFVRRTPGTDDAIAALEDLIQRMLDPDRAKRPRDAAEVLSRLMGIEQEIRPIARSLAVSVRGPSEECRTFAARLEEAAFRGETPSGALMEHIASCRSCANTWEHDQTLYRVPPAMKAGVLEAARREWVRTHPQEPKSPPQEEARPERSRPSVAPVYASSGSAVRQLVAAGNPAGAASELIATLGPRILKYLHAVLRDERMAEEAFSSFAENVWRGVASLGAESSPTAWAFRVAWKAAVTVSARDAHERSPGSAARSLVDALRVRAAPQADAASSLLQRIRESMSLEDSTLLALRVEEGLSWEDIASILGCTEPHARKRFAALKVQLARLVSDSHQD